MLGEGFEQRTLSLGADEEGPIVATLVRHLPRAQTPWQRITRGPRLLENVDVLYVHGWSDYFFQAQLARFFCDHGARFFALDLRKYGRSLREGQTPGFITHLDEYDADIDLALHVIRADAKRSQKLLLMGHSTGGLILTLWADRHPGVADGLILNAPWLALQVPGAVTKAAFSALINLQSAVNPQHTTPQLDLGFYTRAQREVATDDDTYSVDPRWRPDRSQPVTAAWLAAVLEGQRRVAHGLDIRVPVLTLMSRTSEFSMRWSDVFTRVDSVIDVDHVAAVLPKLGTSLTLEWIDGALHDVFLSHESARERAYDRLEAWLHGWVAAGLRDEVTAKFVGENGKPDTSPPNAEPR